MGIKDESKSPISKKVLKKAEMLKVEESDVYTWLVSGGSEPHMVTRLEHDFECDCLAFRFRGICSHVLAVELHLKGGEA